MQKKSVSFSLKFITINQDFFFFTWCYSLYQRVLSLHRKLVDFRPGSPRGMAAYSAVCANSRSTEHRNAIKVRHGVKSVAFFYISVLDPFNSPFRAVCAIIIGMVAL